jgi:hypothetical protein
MIKYSFFGFIFMLIITGCTNNQIEIDRLAGESYANHILNLPLPPRAFVSDGCSCWPDSNWVACCVKHDLIYWKGGTREGRLEADLMLKKCVSEKANPVLGAIMYYGVRLGGVWWLPTPFRWGFGWEYPQSGPPNVPY